MLKRTPIKEAIRSAIPKTNSRKTRTKFDVSKTLNLD